MTPKLDVAAFQRALDALNAGDHVVASERFTDDVELIGAGGCLDGLTSGLAATLDRFADMARLTGGTFGTEVEAVYRGNATHIVVIARHWASIRGTQIHGRQALLVTTRGGRVSVVNALSPDVPSSGIWD